MTSFDAVVVGSGPNGLAAAVALAEAGRRVVVLERREAIGGGLATEELTLPGYHHDVCSAFHPSAADSPFLSRLGLERDGLRWIEPEIPLSHAISPGRSVHLHRSVDETASGLGKDGPTYRKVMGRMVADYDLIRDHVMGPIVRVPRHPIALARFGLRALLPADLGSRLAFDTEEARALFAGCAAHAFLPLDRLFTASFGWFLMIGAHRVGWPIAEGGTAAIAEALAARLRSLGGEIRTGVDVTSLSDLPPSSVSVFDVTPDVFERIAGDRLPTGWRRQARRYRHGPGAYKLDLALDRPIPWADPDLTRAGTVHVGGTFAEIAASEKATWNGRHVDDPFILVGQQSLFDPTRAPGGGHTGWVYAHVPNGTTRDLTDLIERRIEHFAPGFRDTIVARHVTTPTDLETRNPNFAGGDIASGAHTFRQLVFRPFPQRNPYTTPIPGTYLCSAATPPGGGTHGMCGFRAAEQVLRDTP